MKQRLVTFAALLGIASSAAVADSAKAPAPSGEVAMPKIEFIEYDLPNGLHVILHQDRTVPVVSTYVLYHVGSKNERPDRTGFAHFFEHLMFEGSENIPRGQIDKYISAAGGNLNASTSFDRTDYYFNLPANQLKLALWIESERMLHAKVDDTGVETQRQVVKEERRLSVDNRAFGTVFENLAAQVFKGTPYAWTPIGSAQYIDEAKIEEFRDFYKRFYIPNNATLAVAGDFDVEEAKKWIAEYFGPIPKGKPIERPDFTLPPQKEPQKQIITLPTTPIPATIHSWRGPKETDADAPAVELLGDILATGRSSRLYNKLVRKGDLAADVDVFPYLLENGGVIGIFVAGNPGADLEKLDTAVNEEIASIQEKGVTDEELQKAKNQKLARLASAYNSMNSRAENLAQFHLFYGGAGEINHQFEKIRAVTPEAIRNVARKYLTPEGKNLLHYPVAEAAATPAK